MEEATRREAEREAAAIGDEMHDPFAVPKGPTLERRYFDGCPALLSGTWTAHWAYWIGPLVGAALGALLYYYLRGADPPKVTGGTKGG